MFFFSQNYFDLSWKETEMLCETIKCFISICIGYGHRGFGSFIWEILFFFQDIYLTSVKFVGNNSQTNKTSRLVLTLKSNPSSPFLSINKACKTGSVLSSSWTGTRLYINGLCVTAIERVTNLQGFISLEEINLFRLLRKTNFISITNSYIF